MRDFFAWLNEGAKRTVRNRFKDLKGFIGDIDNTTGNKNYTNVHNGKQDLMDAFHRAQQINQENDGEVTVYHMLAPERVTDITGTMRFLMSKSKQEISVSVDKGVWDSNGVVLEGEAKLLLYYPTDVYTGRTSHGQLIPRAPYRSPNSHHWDEAVIRLCDVKWENMYVGNDEYTLHEFGWEKLQNLAKQYDLRLQHVSGASFSSPLSKIQNVKEEIEELIQACFHLNYELFELYKEVERSDVSDEEKRQAIAILDKEYSKDYYIEQDPTQDIYEYLEDLKKEKQRLKQAISAVQKII